MKIKRIALLLICLITAVCASCATGGDYEGQGKVIFNLEGGTYQNTQRAIVHYYPVENGSVYICEPQQLSGEEIIRSGYHIEGWYKTKTQNGDSVEYSDKWDFESDKINEDGVTLYAKWALNIRFTYNVCYLNEAGEKVSLGEYEVKAGEKFKDFAYFAKKRTDGVYTPVAYLDCEGNAWNEAFTHPGGESSVAIDVFVEYIKGDFAIVSTASDLKKYASVKNIYLTENIDMNGEKLSFGDYRLQFIGNGYTVSNFAINYDPGKTGLKEDMEESSQNSLYVSLFGNANGAVIKDVNFENVTVDVNSGYSLTYKIYIAPLGINLTNTQISNVSFSGTYIFTRLPWKNEDKTYDESRVIVASGAVFPSDSDSAIENVTVNFSKR